MPKKFLRINNTLTSGDGVVLIGLKEERVGRHLFWTVAYCFAEPHNVEELVEELAGMGHSPILDIKAKGTICFRVEHGAARCRGVVPEATSISDIKDVGVDGLLKGGILKHPGFHLICECGDDWISCEHNPPSECCG